MPTELDDISRHIMQLEIEEAALTKESDKLSEAHLAEIRKELAEQREKFATLKARWETEKDAIKKVQALREEMEKINADMEQAERNYDLNRAAELKYGRLPKLKEELQAAEAQMEKGKAEGLLRDRITEEEIARIVARWTGIPVSKLMEGEREKLCLLYTSRGRQRRKLFPNALGQRAAPQQAERHIRPHRKGQGKKCFLGNAPIEPAQAPQHSRPVRAAAAQASLVGDVLFYMYAGAPRPLRKK